MDRAKIGVVGWYGHGNIGDESYRLSFPKVFPQYDFVFTEKVQEPFMPAYVLGGGDIISMIPRFAEMLDTGALNPSAIVTDVYEMADIETAFDDMRNRKGITGIVRLNTQAQSEEAQ